MSLGEEKIRGVVGVTSRRAALIEREFLTLT
jgi:hypothetical protein